MSAPHLLHNTPPQPEKIPQKLGNNTVAEESPMTLLGHLNELRKRLMWAFIFVIILFFICFQFSREIVIFVLQPLNDALAATGTGSRLVNLRAQEGFLVHMRASFMAALIGGSPFFFYQIWAFIAPGLYKEERKYIIPIAIVTALFFLAGITFAYKLVLPLAYSFFQEYSYGQDTLSTELSFSFAIKLLFAFGLIFDMPVFAFFLARMGLLTADFMRKKRQYAVLVIFIVAAILTPPDVYTQILMAIPMLFLYEISIFVVAYVNKQKERQKAKQEAQEAEQESGSEKSTNEESTHGKS